MLIVNNIGPCILPGWRLEFRRFCDIDRDPGSEVVGVLWSIDNSSFGSSRSSRRLSNTLFQEAKLTLYIIISNTTLWFIT